MIDILLLWAACASIAGAFVFSADPHEKTVTEMLLGRSVLSAYIGAGAAAIMTMVHHAL